MAYYVSPHGQSYDRGVLLVGLPSEDCLKWWLGGQCQGCKGIHNQIDPKHLHRRQRRVPQESRTNKDDTHGDNVDCQLELNELSYVIVDGATVEQGSEYRSKVVVKQNDVGGGVGDHGPCYHRESYV